MSTPRISAADRRKFAALLAVFRQTRGRLPRAEEAAKAMGWPLVMAEAELHAAASREGKDGVASQRRPLAQSSPPPPVPRAQTPRSASPATTAGRPGEASFSAKQPKRPRVEPMPPPGTAEASAYRWLESRGQTPTPEAVAARLAAVEESRVSGALRAERQARRAAELAAADGPRARDWVAGVRAATGTGPTWRELTAAMGWPHARPLRELIMGACADAGYLIFERRVERSLRPGPRAD
jgi:hypothetical protein